MVKQSVRNGIAVLLTVTILLAAWFFFFSPGVEADPIKKQYDLLSTPAAKKLYFAQSEGLTKAVPQRLVELDQKTIGCFEAEKIMAMSSSDRLGGQCCGVLKDFESYELQLEALSDFIEKNGNIDLIPRDPYDVSVEQAQQLISFDRELVLTPAQQRIYDVAVRMSHHGGPCCCRCWKWTMMSGLGKKLLVDHGWSAEQLAELWDTASSCGHAEDTNLHAHYDHTESGRE